MTYRRIAFALATASLCAVSVASWAADGVPPAFNYGNAKAVPIDIERVDINYEFNAATNETRATAVVSFHALEAGYPFLDLVPDVTALAFDDETLSPALFKAVADPDNVTKLRVLDRLVDTAQHRLTMSYKVVSSDVTISGGRVRAAFFMSDLATGGREYFEQYGPANLEFDQVIYRFTVKVVGTTTEHELFANGTITENGPGEWTIDYPAYFTTSSLFFHLVEKGRFKVGHFDFHGIERTVPVTVYSSSDSMTQDGMTQAQQVLAENEAAYGAVAHARFVIYLTDGGGGMEYCGATTTSLWALGHELTHSWFARGVMPADGNSGWMDEAIASWRDNGYPRASSGPSGSGTNLGGFSPYRRHTTMDAYSRGATLISQLDFLFKDTGGMKAALKQLFAARQRTTISVPFFKTFLESASRVDLTSLFNKYVYGRNVTRGFPSVMPERFAPVNWSRHPRPYSKEERALIH